MHVTLPNDHKKNNRLEKINSLLQHEFSFLFTKLLEPPKDALISFGAVKVTKDLDIANVPVSVLPFARRHEIFKWLQGRRGEIQYELNKRLKTFRVPKIMFILDETEERVDRLGKILDHSARPVSSPDVKK